ncbi:recombinase family protein [Bengtsoniella intestinalis]|uniref:recombinase family protein n=1 Tax=Bengtsoniella intestinalis TaxID=3073143 RepID=UPI00391F9F62
MANQNIVGTSAKREIIHIEATVQAQPSKLRVAGYCRVSSDSSDQLNSFAAQVNYYTQLITNNSAWELTGIYADEGISGVSMDKREDFLRMLEDCRDGKIDRIIAKSSSRFSRNTLDSISTVRELKAMGISVYFEKEGIDTAVLTSENLLTLYSLFAQEESIAISQNCKKGNRMRMAQGTYVSSNAPYGYRLVNKELVVHEAEAETVRRIFREYLSGLGIERIATDLSADCIPTKTGKTKWSFTTVRGILRNERYIGDMLLQKYYGEDVLPYKQYPNNGTLPQYYVKNTHEPIIDEIQYQLAKILSAEKTSQYNQTSERSVLAKKIRCKQCNTIYRRKTTNNKTYWECRAYAHGKTNCPSQRILEESIYTAFIRMYNKLQANRETILVPIITTLTKLQEQGQRGNEELQTINKRIADLSEQNHRMSGLLSAGILDSALFISKTDELKKQLKDARQSKARMLGNLKKDTSLVETEELLETLKEYPTHITTMDEEIFSEIVRKILAQDNQSIDFVLKNGLVLTERL